MSNHFYDTPPGRRAAVLAACDAQPVRFFGIVCGESGDTDTSGIAMAEIVQKFQGSMSKRILVLEPGPEQSPDIYTSPAPPASPLTLFQPVEPVLRRDNSMSLSGEDMTFRSHYYALRRAKAPGVPQPRGGYHPVGTINQYSRPIHLDGELVEDASLPMIDILHMKFRAGVLDNQAEDLSKGFWPFRREAFSKRFWQFRQDFAALHYCGVYWARSHKDADVAVLFIGNSCA